MKKLNLIFLDLESGLPVLPMISMPFFKDQESAEKRYQFLLTEIFFSAYKL